MEFFLYVLVGASYALGLTYAESYLGFAREMAIARTLHEVAMGVLQFHLFQGNDLFFYLLCVRGFLFAFFK